MSLFKTLALCTVLSLVWFSPESPAPAPPGQYDIKAEGLTARCTMFRQGGQVGVEFRVDSPFQPDGVSQEVRVYFSRGNSEPRRLAFEPTATTARRNAATRTDGEWVEDANVAKGFAARLLPPATDHWRALVWIDPEAVGGTIDESWRVGFSVHIEGLTGSHPENPDRADDLFAINLKKLDARMHEGDHPAVQAREAEQRVAAALVRATSAGSLGERIKSLENAIEQDPDDVGLLFALFSTLEERQRNWRIALTDAETQTYARAMEGLLAACPSWLRGHTLRLRTLMQDLAYDPAADYFETWIDRLPRQSGTWWANLFGEGCEALAAAGRWKALGKRLRTLPDDSLPDAAMPIRRSTEIALRAGEDQLAQDVRNLLLTDAESATDTRVWWVLALARAARHEDALNEAETLLNDKRVVADAGLATKLAESCVEAISGSFDPPQAAEECDRLAASATLLPARAKDVLESYAKTCRDVKDEWKAELQFRGEDAGKQNPRVRISTNRGEIVLELFEDDAPNTVANFVRLARDGFYKDRKFYRHEPGWITQGGSPDDTGSAESKWSIKNEENRRRHWRGTIAMARTLDKDSASTHFFITIGNSPAALSLSTDWVVFGRIVDGLDHAQLLHKGDSIISAIPENLRDHDYNPRRTSAEDE